MINVLYYYSRSGGITLIVRARSLPDQLGGAFTLPTPRPAHLYPPMAASAPPTQPLHAPLI